MIRSPFIPAPAGLALLACLACLACAGEDAPRAPDGEGVWIPLFDGETLDGWTPKIAGYPLGEDPLDTFRVEDGAIQVSFDRYGDDYADRFGTLIYAVPYRHYRLRLEYRFTGEQVPGAPDWAERNSGVLYHMQPPETVPRDEGFPVSLEAQFLAEGAHAPTTGNMCSIGTSVVVDGARPDDHCLLGAVPARPLGQWVRFELQALPGGEFRHLIDGAPSITYSDARYDEPHDWADGMAVTGGAFGLQSESHPVAFRNVEIMVLEE